MTTFIYDGTFSGFLTVVAKTAGRWREVSAFEREAPSQQGLFSVAETVAADSGIAAELYKTVGRRVSRQARETVHHAFLSGAEGVEMLLLRYLELALAVGGKVDDMLADERVAAVHRLAARVRQEAHRMKGFVRFMEVTEGFFYARIEPDYDILPLVMPHFAARFGDRHWLIHDLRRKKGGMFDPLRREWIVTAMDLHADPLATAAEEACSRLWQRYFDRLAVGERTNLKLQRAKVPKKYRRHLTEFC